VKFAQEIKCGEPQKILQNEYILNNADATGPFALEPYARVIGFAGSQKVYQYEASTKAFYYKPYMKSIFGLYFLRERLMLESTDGPLSWSGLPNAAGDPGPFDPNLRPKIQYTWADQEQIFYEDVIGYGQFQIVLRAFGQAPVLYRHSLRGTAFDLQHMTVLPDHSHLIVLDKESHINIFPVTNHLFQSYAVDCIGLSPQGHRCTFASDGKMYVGAFAEGSTRIYAKTELLAGVSPYATPVWEPKMSNRIGFFYNNDVHVFEFRDGKPRKIFSHEYEKGTWQLKWLTDRYLAISDGYTEIEVWDVDQNKKIFALTDRFQVDSMFHIPMDYSPVLDSFVVVGKGEDMFPIMEAWKLGRTEPESRHKFDGQDMEYAQIMKFMANGRLLIVGFHHGHVYVVKDFGQPLKEGNIQELHEHQDIIADIGFPSERPLAYSVSEDGSLHLHSLEGDYKSKEIVKSNDLDAAGWLESEQVFWVQYRDNTTVFYDINGRVVDRGDVRLGFVGNIVMLDFGVKVLFQWKRFDVWQGLCRWSTDLARRAMSDMEMEWKTCDVR
jgi:hypothetical protein